MLTAPLTPFKPPAPLAPWQLAAWPITRMLNPLSGARAVKYLLGSVVAARLVVGVARIIADWPANNPTDAPKQDKVTTFLERVFMEGFGTVGTFLVLHATQDAVANLLERFDKKLHPTHVLNQWQGALSPQGFHKATQGLAVAMGYPATTTEQALNHLKQHHNSLAKTLYYGADIAHLRQYLALDPNLAKQALPVAEAYFARLNVMGKLPLLAGLAGSALFGGWGWQKINDTWFRKHIVPPLAKPWAEHWQQAEDAKYGSPAPVALAPSVLAAPSLPLPKVAPAVSPVRATPSPSLPLWQGSYTL